MQQSLSLLCLTLWIVASSPLAHAAPEVRSDRTSPSGIGRPDASWRPVPDAVLAELRGGLRVGRFWVDLTLRARDRIDGRPVLDRNLLAPGSGVLDREGVIFRHEPGARGIVLQVQNARDGIDVQSDVDLRVRVRNFEAVLGSARVRAARALAGRLQAGAAELAR